MAVVAFIVPWGGGKQGIPWESQMSQEPALLSCDKACCIGLQSHVTVVLIDWGLELFLPLVFMFLIHGTIILEEIFSAVLHSVIEC